MLRIDHFKVLYNTLEKLYNINTREKNAKKKNQPHTRPNPVLLAQLPLFIPTENVTCSLHCCSSALCVAAGVNR